MLTLQLVETPQIVKTAGMVGVGVGHQDSIYPAHIVGKRLSAQLRSGIDQDRALAIADKR